MRRAYIIAIVIMCMSAAVLYIAVQRTLAPEEQPTSTTTSESVLDEQSPEITAYTEAYNVWQSHGISHYQMIVLTISPPATPAGLELIIQDGEIVNEIILACERPSDDYPARLCEPLRTWYTWMARYTIDDLFERSEACLEATDGWYCTVQYNERYGYPEEIVVYAPPDIIDGGSYITIRDFLPLD